MTSALLLLEDGAVHAVDPAAPVVRADDLGLLRGESVFETARIASGRAVVVQEHLARLARSAARLGIAVPPGIEQLTQAAVAAWTQPDGVLRLVLTKGGTNVMTSPNGRVIKPRSRARRQTRFPIACCHG